MVFALYDLKPGNTFAISSGRGSRLWYVGHQELKLSTCPPNIRKGFPSTRKVYLAPSLTIFGIGLPCASAMEAAAAKTSDSPAILRSMVNLLISEPTFQSSI